MCASFRSSRSAGLHIGGRLDEGSESEQVGGGSGGLPFAAVRAPLVGHPPCLVRANRGLTRSYTLSDRNILGLP